MTMEAFHAEYLLWAEGAGVPPEQRASNRTFRNVYDNGWRQLLVMRKISQHSRCDQCAKFSARIGSCSDAERPNVEMAQKIHIDGVKAFRCLQDRLQMLSIESTTTTESAPTQSVLKIDIDGLDQAKTRWPRNLSSAKALSQLWRPNIHIVGFIAHGVCEGFLILDNDIPKDASMEMTVLDMVLDWCSDILSKKGIVFPEHLVLEDFLSILETKVMPSKGREMRCCILKGTLNYKAFFEQLDISISGLVPNAKGGEPDVNHSWRFIAREEPYFPDLPSLDRENGEPWRPTEIGDYAPNGKDCVMLVKELVSSDCLSQQPLVILPHDYLPRLCQPLAGMPRTVLADRARKEFLKTAAAVEAEPWNLTRAAAALRDWVDTWLINPLVLGIIAMKWCFFQQSNKTG
ncbi:Uncharacterized protein SCF082_LOCUS41764 [Durusdinium trenchii]|uniref:Uncharacterized protein n=1 Tax=Durusdinium trenchii TaxID=1381693 RepID=A0ABP0K2D7_9DINO